MGNQFKRVRVPKYIRDFNLEKRIEKNLETDKTHQVAPRHPSTVERFKKAEESAPNVDEFNVNLNVVERSKHIQVKSKDGSGSVPPKMEDKRPSREKEEARWLGVSMDQVKSDVDFQKYGYTRPERIRPGHLSLRQFDELLTELKSAKDASDVLDRRADEFKIDKAQLALVIDHFKPLYRVKSGNNESPTTGPVHQTLSDVFSNVKQA